MKVRFSILMPFYNRAEYVRQAIDSVLSQTFTGYELFAIDDGSTDETPEVLSSYGTCITVIRQSNQGPEAARDKAATLAEGEYFVMLDSDDLLFPHALEVYDLVIRTFDSPPLILGSMENFLDGSSPSETQASPQVEVLSYADYLSKRVSIQCSNSCIVIRKSVFGQVGGYRYSTPASFPLDDFNLLLKTGTCGPCIIVQKPKTVAYRRHETNTIQNQRLIVGGILGLVRSEHQGRYPGESTRRWDRYACIGGVASAYALRYCWRRGERKLAFRLLLGTAPMAFAAICKKSLRYFGKPALPIVLPR
jgi:glycosyltransferase involved in cell wall biosynthesis